jgi:hypothetical protein
MYNKNLIKYSNLTKNNSNFRINHKEVKKHKHVLMHSCTLAVRCGHVTGFWPMANHLLFKIRPHTHILFLFQIVEMATLKVTSEAAR